MIVYPAVVEPPHEYTAAFVIARAGAETGEFDEKAAAKLTDKVLKQLEARQTRLVPGVEEIQDIVEDTLIDSKFKKTAKAYIIYRDQHKKLREITSNAVDRKSVV